MVFSSELGIKFLQTRTDETWNEELVQ